MFTARTGASSLELGGVAGCMTARAEAVQSVTVPDAVGAAGPAVFFWYASSTATFFSVNDAVQALSGPYARGKVCLPPSRSGRSLPLTFRRFVTGGDCSVVRVDDVELGTDPGCPAK